MKTVQLVSRDKIHGIDTDEGLYDLNGLFKSPVQDFEDEVHNSTILNELMDMYEAEISQLYDPTTSLEFDKQ